MNLCTKNKYFALALLAVSLASCGGKEEAADATTEPSQVAAQVNDTELTVHQVNFLLQRMPNATPENSKALSLQAARDLVKQEVVAQKAIDDELDRDPLVLQAMDAAKRQILSEVYLTRKLGPPVEPTDAEITQYYSDHPELFAERKIYKLQEIAIKAPVERQEEIRNVLGKSKTLGEFAEWLKKEGLEAKASQGVKAAEQLPLNVLPRLAKMPDGQAAFVNTPQGALVLIVAQTQAQPVSEAQAKPAIAKRLVADKRKAAINAEVEALMSAAKIEYKGEFADAGKTAADKTATDKNGTGKSAGGQDGQAEKPATPAAGAATESDKTEDYMDKGLSGF